MARRPAAPARRRRAGARSMTLARPASASASFPAVWKRWPGSFASARLTIRAASAGRPSCCASISGGASREIFR